MPRVNLLCTVLSFFAFAVAVQAAPLMPDQTLAGQQGAALHQQFRPDGSSVLTSADTKVCMVSRRIDIETSTYRAGDGGFVPFADILRSPATSMQAVANAAGIQGFRVQMKYSPRLSDPIILRIGAQVFDLRQAMETSTDSLWVSGAAAIALETGFRAGLTGELAATSGDTAHVVTDVLSPLDMAALDGCRADIAGQASDDPQLTNEIRVSFAADPETTPVATLPDLRACGMTDPPGRLHLARLESVTGFFAQTDKVFVAFDDAGQVAQAYIPGIFEADFRNGAHTVRISRAADGNLPMVANSVKGCLGAATQTLCNYPTGNGSGHLLAGCMDGNSLGGTPLAGDPVAGGSNGGVLVPVSGRGDTSTTSGGTTAPPLESGTLVGAIGGSTENGGVDPVTPPPPSPVPLPATGCLLFVAAGSLAALRRRKVGQSQIAV
jgi:hypothetical protein